MPCAVFSFTTSILTPHLSPKFCAVLIKYFISHTILRFSSHLYHQLKGKYPPPEYGVKPMSLTCGVSPFSVSVKLDYFFHIALRFLLCHYLYSVLASKHPHIWSNIYSAALVDYQTPLSCLIVYTLSYTINNILSFATEVREDDFCPLSSILCSCGELYQSPTERPLTAIISLLIELY